MTILTANDKTTNAIKTGHIITDSNNANRLAVDNKNSGGNVNATSTIMTDYSPNPAAIVDGSDMPLYSDPAGNLEIRGQTLSDEGSLRDDFSGSALYTALTGTMTFTASSTSILGVGTLFMTEVSPQMYIKKSTDSETLFVRVTEVISDTELVLASNYGGTTASTTGVASFWRTKTMTSGGGNITVSSSKVNLISGTTNANEQEIIYDGDYGPFTLTFNMTLSQRIANQITTVGFSSEGYAKRAWLVFDGTNNQIVKFATSSSTAEIETQSVYLPSGANTSTVNTYKIEVRKSVCSLYINGQFVCSNSLHIPGPYDRMRVYASITNQGTVTTTTASIDYILFSNWDVTEVDSDFNGTPLAVSVTGDVNEVTQAINLGISYIATSGAIITIAANTIVDILMVTPATPLMHLRDISVNITKSGAAVPTNVYLSEGATVSANGTQITPINNHRNSVNTSNMLIYSGATVTNLGTRLIAYVTHTDWETYVAPSYTTPFKLILKPSTKYIFRIDNPSNQAITMTWFLFWMEKVV